MKDDKILKEYIKSKIDEELSPMTFSNKSKEEILRRSNSKYGFIKRILEYEITVSIQPIVAISLAVFIGIGYMLYPMVTISEQDILTSKIEVVELQSRR